MTVVDVALGLHLGQQAGWNQTPADWLRILALNPAGCFVAEQDGTAAGTACTCRFGSVAWIALLLVESSLRGRGIGRALMRHALAWLEQQRVTTIRLDATPLGEPVYRKLGFVAEYALVRMDGLLPARNDQPPTEENRVQAVSREWLPQLTAFDRAITATDRSVLLQRFAEEFPEELRLIAAGDKVLGYMTARPGRLAWQLGPCLANPEVGRRLLDDAARRHAEQRVFLDIPESNSPALAWACEQGLTLQRKLLRMFLGQRLVDDATQMWTGSGPEKG